MEGGGRFFHAGAATTRHACLLAAMATRLTHAKAKRVSPTPNGLLMQLGPALATIDEAQNALVFFWPWAVPRPWR